ncbi:MAG: flagellar basal-body rod protein FlgB [Proteobacteria bacterium SG_bin7]|nr:MAG: flagellar basal-body rod protein FlgB [Proteobacteria bacterium SG_bin7]
MSHIFDKTMGALNRSIDLRLNRQNIINSNIANAETPGYKAKVVDFEDALAKAIATDERFAKTNPGAISDQIGAVKPDVYDNPNINITNDGNTVDMEKEMAALAENTVLYKAAVQLINKKLAQMKYAVTEGGR